MPRINPLSLESTVISPTFLWKNFEDAFRNSAKRLNLPPPALTGACWTGRSLWRHQLGLTFINICSPDTSFCTITSGNGGPLFQPSPTGTDIPGRRSFHLRDESLWLCRRVCLRRNQHVSFRVSPETPAFIWLCICPQSAGDFLLPASA